jgi:hypothetical protein
MQPHTHAVAGTISYALPFFGFNSIGMPMIGHATGAFMAYVSHFLLDYLGEAPYRPWINLFKVQVPYLIIFILLGIESGYPWLYALGWFFGNLPDLIDKTLDWIFGKKQWHSCHGGPGLFQWNGWKLGCPVKIKFDSHETFMIGLISTIILMIFTKII